MYNILNREDIVDFGQRIRAKNKKIVFTNGCFDILHIGHIRYLQTARALGDILVVGVNTDASVRSYKGPNRPINPENDRAEVLAALRCVNYVTLFNEPLPSTLIELLRPDIHVKGGDYTEADLPEAKIVRSYNGKVVIVPLVSNKSTTNIIKKASQSLST